MKFICFLVVFLINSIAGYSTKWIVFSNEEDGIIPHIFVTFISEDEETRFPIEIGAWGFAPILKMDWRGPGHVKEQGLTPKDLSFFVSVTDAEWIRASQVVKDWKDKFYNLTNSTCVHFVDAVAQQIEGLVIPVSANIRLPEEYVQFLTRNNPKRHDDAVDLYLASINKASLFWKPYNYHDLFQIVFPGNWKLQLDLAKFKLLISTKAPDSKEISDASLSVSVDASTLPDQTFRELRLKMIENVVSYADAKIESINEKGYLNYPGVIANFTYIDEKKEPIRMIVWQILKSNSIYTVSYTSHKRFDQTYLATGKAALGTFILLEKIDNQSKSNSDIIGTVSPDAVSIHAEILQPFSEGFAIIKNGTSEAVINSKGDLAINFGLYNFVQQGSEDKAGRKETGFVNGLCKVIKPSGLSYPNKTLQGFVDTKGNLVIPYKYYYSGFYNAELGFGDEDPGPGHIRLIDKNGKDLGEMKYAIWTDNGKISLRRKVINNKGSTPIGFADYNDNIIIPITYLDAHEFYEGLAAVKKGSSNATGKWGFINEKGETIIPFIYTYEPGDFHDGLVFMPLKKYMGPDKRMRLEFTYIDKQGKPVDKLKQTGFADCFYGVMFPDLIIKDWIDFKEGYVAKVDLKSCWNALELYDVKGNSYNLNKLSGTFEYMSKKFDGLSTISNEDYSYNISSPPRKPNIDNSDYIKNGTIMIYCEWKKIITSEWDGKIRYGLVRPDGTIVLPPIFSELTYFDPISNLAYAVYENKDGSKTKGYINEQGQFVIVQK